MHHNSRSPKVIGLIDRQRPRNWIALFCGWNGWNRHFVCLKIEAETLICLLFLFLGVGQVFLLAYDVQRAWNKEQSCMWWSRKSDLCSRTGSIVPCSLADCHRLSAELCYCQWREINKRRSVLVGGGHGGGRRRERLPAVLLGGLPPARSQTDVRPFPSTAAALGAAASPIQFPDPTVRCTSATVFGRNWIVGHPDALATTHSPLSRLESRIGEESVSFGVVSFCAASVQTLQSSCSYNRCNTDKQCYSEHCKAIILNAVKYSVSPKYSNTCQKGIWCLNTK